MRAITLTIMQFNTFVKRVLDSEEFLANISLLGEITNLKYSGNNVFFDLKDSGAMVSCVKFGADNFNVKNGDKVTATGRVNFYVKTGRVSFVASKVEVYGLGDLYQKFIELKQKLEIQGYFRQEIKKEIPKYAKKIGVVTSETGAVIHDIINVARSKNKFTDIILYPSKVQGVNAEKELASGIEYFNTRDDIDVIIVGRGGGSLEDLAPFNTEEIVQAIFKSKIPIISAVGHETDFSLCDFASDLRVPTPSVASDVAVFDYNGEVEKVRQILKQEQYYIEKIISEKKKDVSVVLDSMTDKLKVKIAEGRTNLISEIERIKSDIQKIISEKKLQFYGVYNEISALNPLEILKKGYAVIEKDGKRVSQKSNLSVEDKVKLLLSDGEVYAKIISEGEEK